MYVWEWREEGRRKKRGKLVINGETRLWMLTFLQVIVTVKENHKKAIALKELMHREAGSLVRTRIQEYLRCLKQGASMATMVEK